MPTEQSHDRHSLAGPDYCTGAGRSWIPAIVMRPAAGDHALAVVSVRMGGRGAIPGLMPAAQTDNSCCSARAAEGAVVGGVVVGWITPGSDRGRRGNPRQQGGSLWRACLQMCMQRQALWGSILPCSRLPARHWSRRTGEKTPVRFGTAPCFFRVSREHSRWRTRQSAVSESLSQAMRGEIGAVSCLEIALTAWQPAAARGPAP